MQTKCIDVFTFAELSEDAKERARDWWRKASEGDNDFQDAVYEDADTIAKCLGIEINRKSVQTRGGAALREPAIYYTGFWSQGDGACFEGTYRHRVNGHKAIRKEAPKDTTLHFIADSLLAVQKRYRYDLVAVVKHGGDRYYHAHTAVIETECPNNGKEVSREDHKEVEDALRQFMNWIYARLEDAYNATQAEEYIDGVLIANEYEFFASGERSTI